MEEQGPHKLGYKSPLTPDSNFDPMADLQRVFRRFGLGFAAGVGVSVLLYCFTPMRTDSQFIYRPITIAALKFVIAVGCIFSRRLRPVGVGLLVSIAIGFLVLFGAICGGMRTWN